MTAASFSTKPTAPLMSFLETADDEGVPQYYEGGGGVVERSPPSSSGPPSTRPPSILSPSEHSHHAFMHHYASHAIKTTASGTGMADKDVVDAWRRRQTPEHEDEDDEATLQQQPATSLSDQFSGLLHISAGEGKDAKNRVHRFEDMSDAEIGSSHSLSLSRAVNSRPVTDPAPPFGLWMRQPNTISAWRNSISERLSAWHWQQ